MPEMDRPVRYNDKKYVNEKLGYQKTLFVLCSIIASELCYILLDAKPAVLGEKGFYQLLVLIVR